MRRFVLMTLLGIAATAAQSNAQSAEKSAEQSRPTEAFTAVSMAGPVNVTIDVGKPLSVRVIGSDEFLDSLVTDVSNGELRIRMKERHSSNLHGDARVVITMPRLTRYDMAGAGATTITHMSGDALAITMTGAGSLKGDGTVKALKLQLSGVGSVEARDLHAEEADVRIAGIGSIKLFASERLDAALGGVGSLTYYGDPKIVRTEGGGLGSVTRGR